jgi:SAM-dependent methyltransferase
MSETQTSEATAAHYRMGDYLLGIEGLAIMRHAQRREFDRLESRRSEIGGILDRFGEPPLSDQRDLPRADLQEGYTIWSATFDTEERLENPIRALEGPLMRKIMDGLSGDGPVLDVGCGTGRHTEYLVKGGHRVVGVDPNEAMLELARRKLPDVEFLIGDLENLPVADASFTAVVCGLTFSHLAELGPAMAELARVLKPGGQAAITIPHPLFVNSVLGWRAPVFDAEGHGWEMPEYEHLPSEYVNAFGRAGFVVRGCFEPRLTEAHARWRPDADPDQENPFADALEAALTGQPGILAWVVERP